MANSTELAKAIFALTKFYWRHAAKHTSELTETEFLALDFLSTKQTATVGEITKDIRVLAAQMSRIVRRLEQVDFITADINPKDKRRVDITLTKAGKHAHKTYRDAKMAPIIEALERLKPKQRAQFMSLVEQMTGR